MLFPQSKATRIAILLLAIVTTAILVFFSIRAALASYYSSRGDLTGYLRATALEPSNANYWFLLGRYWQYNFETPDLDRAILAYQKALSTDPQFTDVWLDLSAAYETAGKIAESRNALLKAKSAYPLSPDVAWRYGNFLLRQGDISAAFVEFRRTVTIDPLMSAQAFSVCFRVQPNAQEILETVIPSTKQGYLSILRSLTPRRDVDTSLVVWRRLVAARPQLEARDVAELVGALQQAGRIEEATAVWDQAMALSGEGGFAAPPSSVLWDGGFESEVMGFGYAWSYSPGVHGVQIYKDKLEPHSGRFSLRVTFDGRSDLNFADICHRFPVRETEQYAFSVWVRSNSVTTDQGLRFGLWALDVANKNPVATDDIRGTQGWMRLETSWVAPAGAREAQVCALRRASAQTDNKIAGSVWIDDVSVTPIPPRVNSAP